MQITFTMSNNVIMEEKSKLPTHQTTIWFLKWCSLIRSSRGFDHSDKLNKSWIYVWTLGKYNNNQFKLVLLVRRSGTEDRERDRERGGMKRKSQQYGLNLPEKIDWLKVRPAGLIY